MRASLPAYKVNLPVIVSPSLETRVAIASRIFVVSPAEVNDFQISEKILPLRAIVASPPPT